MKLATLFTGGSWATFWGHRYEAWMYHLKHGDGEAPTEQEYKLFWRNKVSFFYFFYEGK